MDDWLQVTPQGTPVSSWRDVPVMPGAIAGEDYEGMYLYTTATRPAEVQRYYEGEMPQLGWELFAIGQGDRDVVDYDPMLFFKRDSEFATITLLVHPTSDLTYVLLYR